MSCPSDELWAAIKELGRLDPIVDWDAVNLARIQRGVGFEGFRRVRLANHQERNIGIPFHNLSRHLGLDG